MTAALVPDLRNTRVLVVVWAMPGCGACDAYLPVFSERIDAHRAAGAPFNVWQPGTNIAPGEIPVLFYDASSADTELQDFADRLKVKATPTTYILTRNGTRMVEGSIEPAKVDLLLDEAVRANR